MPVLPAASFQGQLAAAWRVVHSGRIRTATETLAGIAARHDDGTAPLALAEVAELASLLLTCRLATGDLMGATAAGEELARFLNGSDPSATIAHLGHGELAAARGDQAGALHHYRAAGATDAADDPSLVPWRSGAAVAMVATGRRKEGAELAREQVALAERSGAAYALARALRTLAITDTGGSSIDVLRRARGAAARTPDLRLAAQIDTDLGGLLLLTGETGEALALLRSAEVYAAGEGLWPLHGRIKRLLQRAGERARPLDGEALAVLTSAEQRVARLAVSGLMNREIAEQLEVSIKAVEWHLSRVYRKLGISSRDALAGLLASSL